ALGSLMPSIVNRTSAETIQRFPLPSHQRKKQEVNAASGWHAPRRPRQLTGKGTQRSRSRFCLQVRRPVPGGQPSQVVWEVKRLLPALLGSTRSKRFFPG